MPTGAGGAARFSKAPFGPGNTTGLSQPSAVIDETPKAYKPIEAVMAAQADLVEIVHTLKQVVCVKG